MTEVRELISPLAATVWWTQSVEDAARHIEADAEAVVVLDLSNRPVGVITQADVDQITSQHPQTWAKKRCACLARSSEHRVRPEHSIEGVIWRYQQEDIQPLLVSNGDEAVGVLHPGAVLRWCAEHHPTAFDALSSRTAALIGT